MDANALDLHDVKLAAQIGLLSRYLQASAGPHMSFVLLYPDQQLRSRVQVCICGRALFGLFTLERRYVVSPSHRPLGEEQEDKNRQQ